ncbi:hypothetical protein AB1Y20_022639 [Prymnesium parvum]|uniref:Uncharacterized protein n=1 Tax=Prymnesium parvum TaxID=97485 RepID=A0AB34JGF2_PRYPA|mmetsp:Transcript_21365/g.53287  ORF Transcript_21365/g.53287 Transcript_21365/m.53287 type:complete len:190 (+) Transcript_21365:367-936(+)
MPLFVEHVDRALLSSDAAQTNRLWEGVKWDESNLTAVTLLEKVSNMGFRCGKSDFEMLSKWASLVSEALASHGCTPLRALYNEYVRNIDDYSSVSVLSGKLHGDSFASMSLEAMRAESSHGPAMSWFWLELVPCPVSKLVIASVFLDPTVLQLSGVVSPTSRSTPLTPPQLTNLRLPCWRLDIGCCITW